MDDENNFYELKQQIKDLEIANNQLRKQQKFGLVFEEKQESIILPLNNGQVLMDHKIFDPIKTIDDKLEKKQYKPIDYDIGLYQKNNQQFLIRDGLLFQFKQITETQYKPTLTSKDHGAFDFINQPNQPINYLIEGDNYPTLQQLKATHKGKIDVIYIDPPYNTGNGEFKYNDNRYNQDDQYQHSKWLNFMKQRLACAQELLSSNGFIFISIDDYHYAHLKLLCDDLFGSSNYISTIIWDKANTSETNQYFQKNNEYILCYSKNKNSMCFNKYKTKEHDVIVKNNQYYIVGAELQNGNVYLNKRHKLGYSIYYNPETQDIIPINDYDKEQAKISNNYNAIYKKPNQKLIDQGYICIRPPKKSSGIISCWTWSYEKMIKDQELVYIRYKKNGGYSVHGLKPIDASKVDRTNLTTKTRKRVAPRNIIKYTNGTSELNKILNSQQFNHPKPTELVKHLLSFFNKNCIVLDFFAGSGTTGHAVQQLNHDDGGKRQYILITNNENNICEEVTYQRMARINNPEFYNLEHIQPLPHNLKYIKTIGTKTNNKNIEIK